MDTEDKKLICSLILDLFSLNVQEKKLDEDDYDQYDENPIMPIQLEIGSYSRTFIGETYKFPVTISVLGINEILVGIKMTLYDVYNCKDEGVFFSVNPEFWQKQVKSNQLPVKKKKYQVLNPLDEKYYIVECLKKFGWKLMMNYISFDNTLNMSKIEGKKTILGYSLIDQIENLFEIQNFLNLIANGEKKSM